MYNIEERLENFQLSFDDDPEIDYLKKMEIVETINRAFADLYHSQPEKPLNYLSNWLFTESLGKNVKLLIEDEKQNKENKISEHLNSMKLQEEENQKKEEIIKNKAKEREEFIDSIKKYENFDSNLNVICDKLCYFLNSTGSYFFEFNNKRKMVSSNEDENAHLCPSFHRILLRPRIPRREEALTKYRSHL